MKRLPFIVIIVVSCAVLFWFGCDEGLKPTTTVPTGSFGGLITYRNWPVRDSLVDLRLVAFVVFPPRDIVGEILQGRAYVYPGLFDTSLVPFYVDSLRYTVTVPAGVYQYVVIAQQFGANVNADWRAVGQYDLDSDLAVPSPVVVAPDSMTNDVNIFVDFLHPPPTPFP